MKKRLAKKLAKRRPEETMGSGAAGALLRNRKAEAQGPARVLEAERTAQGEGARFKVCLITVGLGNRNSMNYYGPEAIASAPTVFEGMPFFTDHPSVSEDQDRPERSVRAKAGYYKNLRIEKVPNEFGQMVDGCVGEAHCDLSEAGRDAAAKFATALHYRQEFPDSFDEYIGLSVNTPGETEPQKREMVLEGEKVEVNYVTRFIRTPHTSCDIVTVAGRGGKILALVESAAGPVMPHKEVRNMIVKELAAAQTALKEALKMTEGPEKTKALEAAHAKIEALSKRVAKEAEGEAEGEAKAELAKKLAAMGKSLCAQAAEMGYEDESESEGEAEDEAEAEGESEGEAANDGASDGDADDAPAKDKKKQAESAAVVEAKREALDALIKASKLDRDLLPPMKALLAMPLAEAKAEIARTKRLVEAGARMALSKLTLAGHGGRGVIKESDGSVKAANNGSFPELKK